MVPQVSIPTRSQRGKTNLQPSPNAHLPQVAGTPRVWIVAWGRIGPNVVAVEDGKARKSLTFNNAGQHVYATITPRDGYGHVEYGIRKREKACRAAQLIANEYCAAKGHDPDTVVSLSDDIEDIVRDSRKEWDGVRILTESDLDEVFQGAVK